MIICFRGWFQQRLCLKRVTNKFLDQIQDLKKLVSAQILFNLHNQVKRVSTASFYIRFRISKSLSRRRFCYMLTVNINQAVCLLILLIRITNIKCCWFNKHVINEVSILCHIYACCTWKTNARAQLHGYVLTLFHLNFCFNFNVRPRTVSKLSFCLSSIIAIQQMASFSTPSQQFSAISMVKFILHKSGVKSIAK